MIHNSTINKEEPSREDWNAKVAELTRLAIPKPPKRVGREKSAISCSDTAPPNKAG